MANEIQTISFDVMPTGGYFTINFNGQQSGPIYASLDTASSIQVTMGALSNIGSGNITVTGDWTSVFQFEFKGTLANTNVPQLLATNNILTASNEVISVTTSTLGVTGVSGTPSTFALTYTSDNGINPITSFTLGDSTVSANQTPTPTGWTCTGNLAANSLSCTANSNGPTSELSWDSSSLLDEDNNNTVVVSDNGSFVIGTNDVAEVFQVDQIALPANTNGGTFHCGGGVVGIPYDNDGTTTFTYQNVWQLDFTQGDGTGTFNLNIDSYVPIIISDSYSATDINSQFSLQSIPAIVSDNGSGGTPFLITFTDSTEHIVSVDTDSPGSTDPSPGVTENTVFSQVSVQIGVDGAIGGGVASVSQVSTGIWDVNYITAGDKTTDTGTLSSQFGGDTLTQSVTPTINTTQNGSALSTTGQPSFLLFI